MNLESEKLTQSVNRSLLSILFLTCQYKQCLLFSILEINAEGPITLPHDLFRLKQKMPSMGFKIILLIG